jgi:peptidoglycan/LPS O-acetylase OafA/YrhL
VTAGHRDGLGYRPGLDGLRALAVLAVIAYHDDYAWARGGFLGVDTFFVLSGFLITTLLLLEWQRKGTVDLIGFWGRRARRLLPALVLVVCFVGLYSRFVVLPWERPAVRGDMLASVFYVANWHFVAAGQSYFELFSAASPVRHMWSLAIEEQYYLVWPIVVLLCLRVTRGSLRLLATVCAVATVASAFAMRAQFVASDPSRAYYGTDARVQTILVGSMLAVWFVARPPSGRTRRVLAIASVPALLAVFAAWHFASATAAWYYHGGALAFAATAALVVAGASLPGPVSAALSLPPLVWIGRISYGLYLWHWPINVWLVPSRVPLGTHALNALRLAATFLAAALSYYLVERPIRARRFRPRVAVATLAPIAGVVVLVVALAGVGAGPPPSYVAGAEPSSLPQPALVSAAGVPPPPEFMWGYGEPLMCGPPRPEETREAEAANRRLGPLGLPAHARRERMLLVGDSTACSLWPGLAAVAADEGIATGQGSVFGCGVASDEIATTRNEAITPHSERCRALVRWSQANASARVQPTIVVWMSTWEKSDLVSGGQTIVAGTAEWRREIMARMDAALVRLTAGGARVVLVPIPAPAPNPAQLTAHTDRDADDAGYVRLNAMLRSFQDRHPDNVTLVDLAAQVCPDGPPCPETVKGLHARPDGRHFTPEAATWAARWLVEQTFAGDRDEQQTAGAQQ